ncbi:MAG: Hsp20/alpha crystallin family protein [Planctomycetota bacterium]|nr:Hsp20/alpha crystallin family protein [Planctomycetota bacterium]
MAREITKWTLLPTISSLQSEMNRMMDRFFRGGDLSEFGTEIGAWIPPIDLSETAEKITVKAEIPGIDPKEVDISIQGDTLLIKGEKKEEKEEKGKNYYRMERRYGGFSRSIDLPSSVDTNKVTAEYKNGVLEITLQKKEAVKPKQISVKVS